MFASALPLGACRHQSLSIPNIPTQEPHMRALLRAAGLADRLLSAVRALALAIATPLLEKNALKTMSAHSLDVPLVFSMARVIVLAFAIAMLHQAWRAGIAGWPEATLSIAIVLAMPLMGALEHARPADLIALAKTLVGRFGIGQTREGVTEMFSREPSKLDDHRADGAAAAAGTSSGGNADSIEAAP
jgi:hypothetical protein